MVNITLKGTSINITCETAEELFLLYWNLGHDFVFIINGEELQQMGPTESKNPNISAYFAGYTRGFFKKFF
jgi:hypothetical protein